MSSFILLTDDDAHLHSPTVSSALIGPISRHANPRRMLSDRSVSGYRFFSGLAVVAASVGKTACTKLVDPTSLLLASNELAGTNDDG